MVSSKLPLLAPPTELRQAVLLRARCRHCLDVANTTRHALNFTAQVDVTNYSEAVWCGVMREVKGAGQILRTSYRPPAPVARWRASQCAVPPRQYTRLEALLVSHAPICRAGTRVVAFVLCDNERRPPAGLKTLRNGRVRIYCFNPDVFY